MRVDMGDNALKGRIGQTVCAMRGVIQRGWLLCRLDIVLADMLNGRECGLQQALDQCRMMAVTGSSGS